MLVSRRRHAFKGALSGAVCGALVSMVSLVALALPASAQEAPTPESTIAAKLAQARPELVVESVQPSVAGGLYEVNIRGGLTLYSTEDGDFFVLGDLFAVGIDGLVNVSEQQRDVVRRDLLAEVSVDDMIVFAAQGERRGVVTVFTDVDCFYCQKLHQEVPTLNKMGVEVRYMAYPRAGLGSKSFRKIASAWCAEDPQQAITALKNLEDIPENVCPGNPVADQFMLGQKAGVNGTPALVLESGRLLPGYMTADVITERMGIN